MAKKKGLIASPGKAGIWHNIKKIKKPNKSAMKSLGKQFGKVKNPTSLLKNRVKSEKPLGNVLSSLSGIENRIVEDKNDPSLQGLSEYEKIRLRNIREREALFEKLQIKEAKSLVSPSRKTEPKNEKKPKEKQPKENIPARKSLRISNGPTKAMDRSYAAMTRPITLPPRREEGLKSVETSRFKVLQVSKNCTIEEFVLENSLAFKCGRGFYQFTKPEIISYKKEVVIVEKSTGEMFTGQEACDMIGAGSGIRTPPTTFAKWRVFVQSTSVGRKLVAGTAFLYQTD